jgi:hypothetical protein
MTPSALLPKEPVFTIEELQRFANIFDNAGQVFLGVTVLSPLVAGLDTTDPRLVFLGVITTILSWFLSWRLTKEACQR